MTRRDLLLIIGAMACFTAAIAALIILNAQSAQRSEVNIGILCQKLVRVTNEPCGLLQPSDTETKLFAFIRRD